ncbi:hypothetical protein F383_08609 [Gossypium arboreum]|uniref:Uncharacterized protein n=1 Tax=Gossypium arboreum TaxID=29729 RepID=A0A0B0NU03_GOSAR|nr:hypothetical protein F383_08609 [Gossypium arboreum]
MPYIYCNSVTTPDSFKIVFSYSNGSQPS